jgi:intracellular septation protein A
VINFGLLIVWFVGFIFARDWIRRYHGKWFKLSEESFDAIHYAAMAFFKLLIFVFNLVPYIALLIVGD